MELMACHLVMKKLKVNWECSSEKARSLWGKHNYGKVKGLLGT